MRISGKGPPKRKPLINTPLCRIIMIESWKQYNAVSIIDVFIELDSSGKLVCKESQLGTRVQVQGTRDFRLTMI